jgi:Kip1 ubiquitination-promoting complex protein 1
LCWLLEVLFNTLSNISKQGVLFGFIPETYINILPILLDTVLDFSFHDTGVQHNLSGSADLVNAAGEFLGTHLADPRVVLASCKDSMIQAIGALTCHQKGIQALEQASEKSQNLLVEALLRPYENRAWGQSNWLLLRFWLGEGFAFRESRPACIWQGGQSRHSLGLYRSRSKSGSSGLLHLIAPACPSRHFQFLIGSMLANDEPFCTKFLNSLLSQLNWGFSEFIHILQDVSKEKTFLKGFT